MVNIPRFFSAFAEWSACIVFIYFATKRTGWLKLAPVALLWLGILFGWKMLALLLPHILWPLGIVVAAALMLALIFICCKVQWQTALFMLANAFILAEFVASVEWQLFYYLKITFALNVAQQKWFEYFFAAIIYGACLALVVVIEKKFFKDSANESVTLKNLIPVLLIVIACFASSNLGFLMDEEELTDKMLQKVFEVRTLFDFSGLVLIYGYRVIRDTMARRNELANMQNILDKQYTLYKQYKENDEIIGRQYHDLKHQIDVILNEEQPEKRTEYLKEMRRSIKVRQSESFTGNKVVDTVLSSKSYGCVEDGITLNVVADGKLLDFMSTMDICSVLGNSIDNAIESVKKVADPEKRLIDLALFEQNDMVVYRIRNYFEEAPIYVNSRIVTRKADKGNHGYGLKSIRAVTEKYEGTMTVSTKDNWFTLCLMIPLVKQ